MSRGPRPHRALAEAVPIAKAHGIVQSAHGGPERVSDIQWVHTNPEEEKTAGLRHRNRFEDSGRLARAGGGYPPLLQWLPLPPPHPSQQGRGTHPPSVPRIRPLVHMEFRRMLKNPADTRRGGVVPPPSVAGMGTPPPNDYGRGGMIEFKK